MVRAPRGVLAMLVVVAIAVAACGGGGGTRTAGDLTTSTFSTLDGSSTTSLSATRGTPTLVNFFGSWCDPCIAEMPTLQTLSLEYAGRVSFVGIATQDSPTKAAQFVTKTGVTYPIGLDPDGSLFTKTGALGMPTTVLLRADGSVADLHTGALSADAFRSMIDKAFFR